MEDGASGEMVAGGEGAPGGRRGGGGAKRGRGERESGGAVVAWGQQQGEGGSASASASASRICRVKANGGKDRHSKVVTVKGVRDRRVRLAVPTAIQFYDLQDRLGFDQPSKAVEWLIDAASHAIGKLPPLDPAAFPFPAAADAQQATTPAQAASFTELLTGNAIVAAASEHIQSRHRQQQQQQQPGSAAADPVGFAHPANNNKGAAQEAYTGIRFGNALPLGMVPARPLDFTTTNSAAEIAPFSFVQDVLAAASAPAPAPAADYSLDFSMSSGCMGGGGNSRGTFQSNSNSQSHFSNQLQLHELDGPSPPFLYDPTAPLQLWNGFRMEEKSQN